MFEASLPLCPLDIDQVRLGKLVMSSGKIDILTVGSEEVDKRR
jgi:hypothetical protein